MKQRYFLCIIGINKEIDFLFYQNSLTFGQQVYNFNVVILGSLKKGIRFLELCIEKDLVTS